MDHVKNKEREVIEFYLDQGYQIEVILDFLKSYHDLEMSLSTLKRRLREYGLPRTKGLNVEPAIHLEVLINNNCLLISSFPLYVWPTKPTKTNGLSSERNQPRSEKPFCLYAIFFCLHRDSCWFFVCIRSFLFAS